MIGLPLDALLARWDPRCLPKRTGTAALCERGQSALSLGYDMDSKKESARFHTVRKAGDIVFQNGCFSSR